MCHVLGLENLHITDHITNSELDISSLLPYHHNKDKTYLKKESEREGEREREKERERRGEREREKERENGIR